MVNDHLVLDRRGKSIGITDRYKLGIPETDDSLPFSIKDRPKAGSSLCRCWPEISQNLMRCCAAKTKCEKKKKDFEVTINNSRICNYKNKSLESGLDRKDETKLRRWLGML